MRITALAITCTMAVRVASFVEPILGHLCAMGHHGDMLHGSIFIYIRLVFLDFFDYKNFSPKYFGSVGRVNTKKSEKLVLAKNFFNKLPK